MNAARAQLRLAGRTRTRRGPRSRIAALLAALMVLGLLGAPAASADPGDPLGPTLVKTDQGPSGYAVQFRYEAPEGVETVHVWGDWFFSRPEGVTGNDVSDRIHPADWRPGLIAATPWLTIPMTKGPDGIWEVTVPLPAGSYRYVFTHNCASITATNCETAPDPANPWELPRPYPNAPGLIRSTVFVPTHPDFPTYDNDYQAPLPEDERGTLLPIRYTSSNSSNPPGVHDMVVYLPADYDPDREIPYPTLYLSHGSGDHSTAWTMQGVAHYILEHAVRDGEAEPMVIVSTDFNGLTGANGYIVDLSNNVIPYIEEHFNVSKRPEDRAFGGFSAGGSQASTILYNFTDLFGYHAVWSWAPPAANATHVERMNGVRGGIHIGTGLQDRLANIAANTLSRIATLKSQGVELTDYHVPGVHTWHVWRPLLNFYLREMLFEQSPQDRLGWLVEDGAITEGLQGKIANALQTYEEWSELPGKELVALSHLDRAVHLLLWQADVVEDKGKSNQGDPDGLRRLAASILALRASHQ